MTNIIKLEPSEGFPMMDVYMPMMKASAIISAGQLGLFTALADGALSSTALAKAINASEVAVEKLADFLVTLGYLERQGDNFANAAHTQRWFTKHGDIDYTSGLLWTAEAWQIMGTLADVVRNGEPKQILWDSMVDHPQMGVIFSSYMHASAKHLSPELLKHLRIPEGALRLLDLGGSHGLHSIAFCRRYLQLHAVIVDMESALTHTSALVSKEGLSERISILPGNLLDGNWGGEYDVVFYFFVAHNQTAEDNRKVLARISKSLRPGGMLVIHEHVADTPLSEYQAAFRLTLLTETTTRTYSFEEISGWLKEAGFKTSERIDLAPGEKGTLIIARG